MPNVRFVPALMRKIDQTSFLNKLYKWSPYVLAGLTTGYMTYDTFQVPPEQRKKRAIRNLSVGAGTLLGAWGSYELFLRPKTHEIEEVAENLVKYVEHHGGKIFRNLKDELDDVLKRLDDAKGKKAKEAAEDSLTELYARYGKESNLPESLKKHLKGLKEGEMDIKQVQSFQAEVLKSVLTHEDSQYNKLFKLLNTEEQDALTKLLDTAAKGELGTKQTQELMELLYKVKPKDSVFKELSDKEQQQLSTLLAKGQHITDEEKKDVLKLVYTAKAKSKPDEKLVDILIPSNAAADSKEMLSELIDLSGAGLLPVTGGVVGGLAGNLLNKDKDWKEKLSTEIQEGLYQFFANIMLCNIGAALMLMLVEHAPGLSESFRKNATTRLVAMVTGIVTMGVVFGGYISNLFGNNLVKPMMEHGVSGGMKDLKHKIKDEGAKSLFKDVYGDRKPTFMDVIVHLDDLLTVGYMSGLKIIGPLLPGFYALSAVRSGFGYRNGKQYKARQAKHHQVKQQAKETKVSSKTNEIKEAKQRRKKMAMIENPALSHFETDNWQPKPMPASFASSSAAGVSRQNTMTSGFYRQPVYTTAPHMVSQNVYQRPPTFNYAPFAGRGNTSVNQPYYITANASGVNQFQLPAKQFAINNGQWSQYRQV